MLSLTLLRELELQEMAYLRSYYEDLPPELVSQYGAAFYQYGGSGAAVTAHVDLLAINRVVGLGLQVPPGAALIDELIASYQRAGASRFFIQPGPLAQRAGALPLLEAKGFRHHNNWVKLYRPVQPLPSAETDLRIEEIDATERDSFADIIVRGFEWTEALRPYLAHPVGRPGWKHYLAYEGDHPVACAALFIRGEYASMAFAATLPGYRGRGAQSALLARRFRDAAEAGCRWAVVETGEEQPGRPVASYRNMRRLGFEAAYVRPNYIMDFSSF